MAAPHPVTPATPLPADHSPSVTDGLLLVDKPAGVTSHDVVGRVRRAFRTRRVGHAGTLDPFATGLLVCALGTNTRLLPYVSGEPKVYAASILFGTATNTDDATGIAVADGPPPDWARLDAALQALTGSVAQVPPAYSAKHVNGERAYARARRGEDVALAPVTITVHQWEVTARAEHAIDVVITCGGGTYIRALARDLGLALGTVAHCATLRRLRSGPFDVSDAVAYDALVPDASSALGSPLLSPLLSRLRSPLPALDGLSVQPVSAEALAVLHTGRPVVMTVPGERAALVAPEGTVVGVAERVERAGVAWWQPKVVLTTQGGGA